MLQATFARMNLRQKGVAVERLSSQHFTHGYAAPQDIQAIHVGELAESLALFFVSLTENAKLPTAQAKILLKSFDRRLLSM